MLLFITMASSKSQSPRSLFLLKRVWTLVFFLFIGIWFVLIRHYAPRESPHRAPIHTITPLGRHTASAPVLSRAAIFESLIVTARAGVAVVREPSHYENDMGFCGSGGPSSAATATTLPYAAPTVCPPHRAAAALARSKWSFPSAWFGGAAPSSSPAGTAPQRGAACVDAQHIDELISEARSALCREIAPAAEGVLVRARAAAFGRASGGAAAETTSSADPAVLPIWSTPVCAFLARERVAAERDGGAASPEDDGAPKGVITACGVRVTAADIAAKCGAAPDFDAVPAERTVDPYSRAAPRTFFLWNKALAAASDVSPSVMIDDSYDFNETDYAAKLGAAAPVSTRHAEPARPLD